MEFFRVKRQGLLAVTYFRRNALSQMFEWFLNTSLSNFFHVTLQYLKKKSEYFLFGALLNLSCIMLKNGQTYFKIFAVWTKIKL